MTTSLMETREERKKRLNKEKDRRKRCKEQAVPCLKQLSTIVEDAYNLFENPTEAFSKMFNDQAMLRDADAIRSAVLYGLYYGKKYGLDNSHMKVLSNQVETVYLKIMTHLKMMGNWGCTVCKFSEKAIKSAIKRIIICFDSSGKDDEIARFDWVIEFEHLRNHDSISEFLEDLARRQLIPKEPFSEYVLHDLALENLKDLMDKAGYLGMVVLDKSDYAKLKEKAKKWEDIENLWIG